MSNTAHLSVTNINEIMGFSIFSFFLLVSLF